MPTPTPVPRRSVLKAAGAALAGLGLPGLSVAAGAGADAATGPVGRLAMTVPPVLVPEARFVVRSPSGAVARPARFFYRLNDRPFMGFPARTLLFAGYSSVSCTVDGLTIPDYEFVHRPSGWRKGFVSGCPSADFSGLFPDGAIPKAIQSMSCGNAIEDA